MPQKLLIALLTALFLFQPESSAAVITANTCSQPDISAAVAAAVARDTVQIPAGTCSWKVPIMITKGITLQGVVGETIILDAVTTSSALFRWVCQPGMAQRLTGIEFRNGTRTVADNNGRIRIECTNLPGTTFRLDHNKFDRLNGLNVRPDTVIGVMDHNEFVNTRHTAIYIFDSTWNGVGNFGDSSWASPVAWGGSQFLFIEDNSFTGGSAGDGYRGTRAVWRHNTFTDCHITVHGTESSGRNRGGRATEIYSNTFTNTKGRSGESIFANIRSGSALIWGNRGINLVNAKVGKLNQDRTIGDWKPYFGADGSNPWDVNDPAGPFDTRTVTSSGKLSVTSAGATWMPNQWAGYSIKKASVCPFHGPAGNCQSIILSNTADTLTYISAGGHGSGNLSFVVGNTFEIRRVAQVLDGIGRGGGSLITGPAAAPVRPITWNDQTAFPLYEWDNLNNGQDMDFGPYVGCRPCIAGEHFFNDTRLSGYVPFRYPHWLTIAGSPPGSGGPPGGVLRQPETR